MNWRQKKLSLEAGSIRFLQHRAEIHWDVCMDVAVHVALGTSSVKES